MEGRGLVCMWNYSTSYGKIRVLALFLLLLLLFASPASGSCETPLETKSFMTVQIEQWNGLKQQISVSEMKLLAAQEQLQMLKRPSGELRTLLLQAQEQLRLAQSEAKKSQTELQGAKQHLQNAVRALEESEILSKTLKTQIEKERRVHRRQLWQNRLWFMLGGAVIAAVAK